MQVLGLWKWWQERQGALRKSLQAVVVGGAGYGVGVSEGSPGGGEGGEDEAAGLGAAAEEEEMMGGGGEGVAGHRIDVGRWSFESIGGREEF